MWSAVLVVCGAAGAMAVDQSSGFPLIQVLTPQNGAVHKEDEQWYWDPQSTPAAQPSTDSGLQTTLEYQKTLQQEIANLTDLIDTAREENAKEKAEVERLNKENKNLSKSLEDLDGQHQTAMERMLTLKKELQKNFELLKIEHETLQSSNEKFTVEIEKLKNTIAEKDEHSKKILESTSSEYDTLHHKYVNLEKVHSLLQETTEKFQEENQDLHEEVFKLQEELAKYDLDENGQLKSDTISDMIPREKYEELLKDYTNLLENKNNDISLQLDELNIDDNAKSLIKNLKVNISDLKRQLQGGEVSNHVTRDVDSVKEPNYSKIVDIYNKLVTFNFSGDKLEDWTPADNCNISEKIEIAIKGLIEYKKEVEELKNHLQEQSVHETRLRNQLEEATSDNEFLTADLTQCERELSEMKKNNDFLLSEITALKNASKLQPIIESHEDNLVKLESELAESNTMNKNFKTEIDSIERKLREVNEEKIELQKDLNELRSKYNSMLRELESLKSLHDESYSHGELQSKLYQATTEIEDLKSKLIVVTSKNEQLSIDYSIATNEALLFEHQVSELRQKLLEMETRYKKLSFLENKLDDLEKGVQQVTTIKKRVETDRKMLIDKVKKFTEETATPEGLQKYKEILLNRNSDIDIHLNKLLDRLVSADNSTQARTNENENISKQISEVYKHEIEKLKAIIKEKEDQLFNANSQLISCTRKENDALEEQMESLNSNLQNYINSDHKVLVDTEILHQNLSKANEEINRLREQLALAKSNHVATENDLLRSKDEQEGLLKIKEAFECKLKEAEECEQKAEGVTNQLKKAQCEVDTLNNTILTKDKEISILTETINKLKESMSTKETEIQRLKSSGDGHSAFSSHKINESYDILLRERDTINLENLELENKLQLKEMALSELKREFDTVQRTLEENLVTLDTMKMEKAELINFITTKHNENIQYHNEIQRLNQIIMKHVDEYKSLLIETEKLQKEVSNCSECVNLKFILKGKDDKIHSMERLVHNKSPTIKRELDTAKEEITSLTDTVANLTNKCEELDKNLTIQLDVVKNLTAEKMQLSEKEQSLSRELTRLRRHLAESEENHTQEVLAAEARAAECKTRLLELEERAKHTGTLYTSNNIRSQQELETLRAQLRLLERQREEAQARLASAEDDCRRGRVALANLQLVIEQFQTEKERDIEAATIRLRTRELDMQSANASLRTEIVELTRRLEESMAGLQAAARLGDQLEAKSAQVLELREQVSRLQEEVSAAQAARAAGGADRVDKGLVKNLLINYLQATNKAADRLQVLRVLSTVLDFNQQECERAGLTRGGQTDSLAREFVRFLEKESRPLALPPLSLSLAPSSADTSRSSTPLSRKNSGLGPPPVLEPMVTSSHRRTPSASSNNALLQSLDLLEASPPDADRPSLALRPGLNQTRNTEGAILKNVLRDM